MYHWQSNCSSVMFAIVSLQCVCHRSVGDGVTYPRNLLSESMSKYQSTESSQLSLSSTPVIKTSLQLVQPVPRCILQCLSLDAYFVQFGDSAYLSLAERRMFNSSWSWFCMCPGLKCLCRQTTNFWHIYDPYSCTLFCYLTHAHSWGFCLVRLNLTTHPDIG